MKPQSGEPRRTSRNFQEGGTNWILMAGGALLSSLSIRLGYKLKQVLDAKQLNNSKRSLKDGKSTDLKKSGTSRLHSNAFCFTRDEDGCYNHYNGSRNGAESKQQCNGQMITEPELARPVEFNGVMWSSSPDRLERAHQSSSSESCVSESGSDIFSKREVIQKLRQQLKRRDDMILEMQEQIAQLQNSISAQMSHSSHLQSALDAANRDLFESEREIQRLRKAIADHCVGNVNSNEKPTTIQGNLGSIEKGREVAKIEMLKSEVNELKELIEGKDYLLQSYKEQKSELSVKIKELQQRLDSQLLNIL